MGVRVVLVVIAGLLQITTGEPTFYREPTNISNNNVIGINRGAIGNLPIGNLRTTPSTIRNNYGNPNLARPLRPNINYKLPSANNAGNNLINNLAYAKMLNPNIDISTVASLNRGVLANKGIRDSNANKVFNNIDIPEAVIVNEESVNNLIPSFAPTNQAIARNGPYFGTGHYANIEYSRLENGLNPNLATFSYAGDQKRFIIRSGSPGIEELGINLLSDNLEVGGNVAVSGTMPIYGAVTLNGNVPVDGMAAVNYNCG